MEGGRGGGLTLGRGNRESFFHTQLSWDRMGLPAQGQKKDDGKKRFCCRSFPYVVSKMGGGCFFRSHMAQKINTNLMRRRRTLNFPTTKSSCGTRWGKNGRSGFILAWRMDDGWWGGHQRKSKQKPQRNNKTKFTPTQPTPNPNVKQKQKKSSNLKQPSSWVQIDTEERCSYVHHTRKNPNKRQQKRNQHHVMQLFIRLEAGQGMRIWISVSTWWNVQYVWVCMTTSVATIWGEGTMFS